MKDDNQEKTDLLKSISEEIDSTLEEGIIYYAIQTCKNYGTSGGTPYIIKNGLKSYSEAKGLKEKLRDLPKGLFYLTTSFSAFTKVKYTFQKGEIMKMEVCTPKMLQEEMILSLRKEMLEPDMLKIDSKIIFYDKGELQLDVNEKHFCKDKTHDFDFSEVEDELECLYHALGKALKEIHFNFENDKLTIQSLPSFPAFNMSEIVKNTDVSSFKKDDLNSVYEYLESREPEKIALALEVLKENKPFLKKAEKRYLNLIQARTNHSGATLLEHFAEGILNNVESKLLLGNNLDKNYISYGMLSDEDCKTIVDVIGSILKNSFKIDVYIEAAKKTKNKEELAELYGKYVKKSKTAIKKEIKNYPDGWWSKIMDKVVSLDLEKVMFDHTGFDVANSSLVLKEYMFYMNFNNHYGSTYLDIHQSDNPDLTEIFWLLPKIPTTNWSDVEPDLPESPLSFKRVARMRVGDFGRWKSVKR